MIILLLTAISLNTVIAQNNMSDVFDGETKITFLGLDFTQAKFIGQDGFNDPEKIKTYYLQLWNEMLETEYDKYNIKEQLRAENYTTSVDDMIALNDGYDVKSNILNGTYNISEKDVEKAVKKYKLSSKEGIGVVYVVESFSKTDERAYVWVTFINMKNNKVLYTEKVEAKAGGFGFRNYWLGAVYNVNKTLKSRYRVWKKKFVSK